MRLTKFSLIIAVLALAVFFGKNTFAEEAIKEAPLSSPTVKVIAQVNLQDAAIVSQEGNTLNITFNLNNREGAQSGVRYGVLLMEDIEGKQIIADEYVYPEVLSLGENTTVTKNISYTPPFNISGDYIIYVSARNYSGLPFGSSNLGKVNFSEQVKTIEIIPGTCSTSIERASKIIPNENTRIISVSKGDKISLSCVVKNNLDKTVVVSPLFETFIRTLYGEEVEELPPVVNHITLRPLEEKTVNFSIPEKEIPQIYITKVFVEGDGVKSNSVLVQYIVSGLSATIQNVALDKSSYKKDEIATISLYWHPKVSSEEELKSISYKADIVGKNKRSCLLKTLEGQVTKSGVMEIPTNIVRSCDDPEVTIALLDATGKVLDQKALVFEANEKTNLFQGKTGIIAIIILALLVIAGIIIYVKNLKKDYKPKDDNSNTPKSGHIEGAMLAIFFILSMFLIPGGNAKADVYYVNLCNMENPPYDCWDYGTINVSVSLNKSTYAPGETMALNWSLNYSDAGYHTASIYYFNAYGPGSTASMYGGTLWNNDYETGTVYFTAPSAGSYNISIEIAFGLGGYSIYCISSNYTCTDYKLYYTVSNPNSTVDVTADYANSLTINSGNSFRLRWTSDNATGGCECVMSGGTTGSCGSGTQNPTGTDFWPGSTTTYTVTCDP